MALTENPIEAGPCELHWHEGHGLSLSTVADDEGDGAVICVNIEGFPDVHFGVKCTPEVARNIANSLLELAAEVESPNE